MDQNVIWNPKVIAVLSKRNFFPNDEFINLFIVLLIIYLTIM